MDNLICQLEAIQYHTTYATRDVNRQSDFKFENRPKWTSDGDNGSSRKRAVFSALISEASDRKLTFELQRLLVVVIKLGQNKGLLEHDHE